MHFLDGGGRETTDNHDEKRQRAVFILGCSLLVLIFFVDQPFSSALVNYALGGMALALVVATALGLDRRMVLNARNYNLIVAASLAAMVVAMFVISSVNALEAVLVVPVVLVFLVSLAVQQRQTSKSGKREESKARISPPT